MLWLSLKSLHSYKLYSLIINWHTKVTPHEYTRMQIQKIDIMECNNADYRLESGPIVCKGRACSASPDD